mgnify:CR=1 FL=1
MLPLFCDVRFETQVAETVQRTVETFGRLDILVANAGVIHAAELTEMTLEQWQWQIDVNLTGYFLCAREAAKVMKTQGSGVIIQSIAMDLAPYGIRVNAICPGNLFESPMWQESLFEQYARKWGIPQEAVQRYYEAQVPLGRGCTYEDVCNLLVFLASDEASYITGEAYRVAGGQL